jgi:hypothetical protein
VLPHADRRRRQQPQGLQPHLGAQPQVLTHAQRAPHPQSGPHGQDTSRLVPSLLPSAAASIFVSLVFFVVMAVSCSVASGSSLDPSPRQTHDARGHYTRRSCATARPGPD